MVSLLGCALLAAVAILDEGAFRLIVHEDSVLEWAEVCAYAAAAIVAVRTVRTS